MDNIIEPYPTIPELESSLRNLNLLMRVDTQNNQEPAVLVGDGSEVSEKNTNGSWVKKHIRIILTKLIGFPIYTIDFDGTVRKRRAKILGENKIITKGIVNYNIGNANDKFLCGTFSDLSYISKWIRRKTWWFDGL